jgi:hypothetical protein
MACADRAPSGASVLVVTTAHAAPTADPKKLPYAVALVDPAKASDVISSNSLALASRRQLDARNHDYRNR